jgi:hypothetical protein
VGAASGVTVGAGAPAVEMELVDKGERVLAAAGRLTGPGSGLVEVISIAAVAGEIAAGICKGVAFSASRLASPVGGTMGAG